MKIIKTLRTFVKNEDSRGGKKDISISKTIKSIGKMLKTRKPLICRIVENRQNQVLGSRRRGKNDNFAWDIRKISLHGEGLVAF